jgi:hypothetical protein
MTIPPADIALPPLRKKERILLLAGLVPLPWFLLWTSIAGAMVPGYRALSQQGSELTLLPGLPHVLLDVAAIGSGVAFMAFALGMWFESGRQGCVPRGRMVSLRCRDGLERFVGHGKPNAWTVRPGFGDSASTHPIAAGDAKAAG